MRWICTVGMINGHVNEHTKNLKKKEKESFWTDFIVPLTQ